MSTQRRLIDKNISYKNGITYYEYTYEVITPKKGKISYYTTRRAYENKRYLTPVERSIKQEMKLCKKLGIV